jgi:hypothetical protein
MARRIFGLAMLAVLLSFAMVLVGCSSERQLLGRWQGGEGTIEFFSDGRGSFDGDNFSWTVSRGRVRFDFGHGDIETVDFRVSGRTLTLPVDGETMSFTRVR